LTEFGGFEICHGFRHGIGARRRRVSGSSTVSEDEAAVPGRPDGCAVSDGLYSTSRADLDSSLRESFRHGADWPIDRASLTALIDMGLSNAEIASYFAVAPDDVHMLRDQYGIVS
jgi:hypothetical protein